MSWYANPANWFIALGAAAGAARAGSMGRGRAAGWDQYVEYEIRPADRRDTGRMELAIYRALENKLGKRKARLHPGVELFDNASSHVYLLPEGRLSSGLDPGVIHTLTGQDLRYSDKKLTGKAIKAVQALAKLPQMPDLVLVEAAGNPRSHYRKRATLWPKAKGGATQDSFKIRKGRVTIRVKSDGVLAEGSTFPIKDALKRKGFRWVPSRKEWWAAGVKMDSGLRRYLEGL